MKELFRFFLIAILVLLYGFEGCTPVAICPNIPTTLVGTTVELTSESYDPDGDSLTYLWEFTYVPEGSKAEIKDADANRASFVPDIKGQYSIKLSVSDGIFTSSCETFVDVLEDNPYGNLGSPFYASARQLIGVNTLKTYIDIIHAPTQQFPTYGLTQPPDVIDKAIVVTADDHTLELIIKESGEYTLTLTSENLKGDDPLVVELVFNVLTTTENLDNITIIEQQVYYAFIEAMLDPDVDDATRKSFLTEECQQNYEYIKGVLQKGDVSLGDLVDELSPESIVGSLVYSAKALKTYTYIDDKTNDEVTSENHFEVIFKYVDGWKIHKLAI